MSRFVNRREREREEVGMAISHAFEAFYGEGCGNDT